MGLAVPFYMGLDSRGLSLLTKYRMLLLCGRHAGCTVGSTLADQQLRELRDGAANASDRCRQMQQQQQPSWSMPRFRSDMDQSVFRIYKGIKCFDFCKSQNVVATGGIHDSLCVQLY